MRVDLVELDLAALNGGEYGGRAIGEALALNTNHTRLNLVNSLVGDAAKGRAIRLSWGQRPGELLCVTKLLGTYI